MARSAWVAALGIVVVSGCKPRVPPPWTDLVPKEHLVEVGAGSNSETFFGVYDQAPLGVVLAFRSSLAKGGFENCGEPGRAAKEAWGYFRKDGVLWELAAVDADTGRTPVDLKKFIDPLKLEATGCSDAKDGGIADAASAAPATPASPAAAAPSVDAGSAPGNNQQTGATVPTKKTSTRAVTPAGKGVPKEVVQRIVRQNFGRMRLCYENGLRKNPNLKGHVNVKFVIDPSGAVSSATDSGSDLPDQDVVACVIRGFKGLSFPPPEDKTESTNVYPITFSPGD